jgi:REP element-mobilizing transposase RayT
LANTFTQIHIHIIFAVENRISLISDSWKDKLYQYITAITIKNGHKPLAINGMPDHLHIVCGLRPVQSISDLLQDIKGYSSGWINKSNFIKGKFRWQDGYGAFSYSKSQLPSLINYVHNQTLHHRKKTFLEEYREILDRSEIDYDPRYLFHSIEN